VDQSSSPEGDLMESLSHNGNIQNKNVHPEGQELCGLTGTQQQVRTRSLDG